MSQFFDTHEDGGMRSFPDFNLNTPILEDDASGHVDESFKQGWGVKMFKSSQITGESPVKGISDHGPKDIEVDSDHQWR